MTTGTRNGADLLIETAVECGIDTCFANPGTTELHLVDALGRAAGMRTILTLFEGVVSGATDGYARMAGKPALGLYHLGPGLANSLANQHNARRHGSPIVNVIGDQASWHLPYDAPLTSDIDALTGWAGQTRRVRSADDSGPALAEAVAAAGRGAGGIASVIVPADHAWGEVAAATPATAAPGPGPADGDRAVADPDVVTAAARLLQAPGAALVAGGVRITETALRVLGALRAELGIGVHLSRVARIELGRDLPEVAELPYFPDQLRGALADVSAAVMIGRQEPVTFFGYPGESPLGLPDDADRLAIDGPAGAEMTLIALAAALGVDWAAATEPDDRPPLEEPSGPLDGATIGAAFASAIPAGAIVVPEAITSLAGYRRAAPRAERHTLLTILGGAIGGGLPNAVGAAVACPDRPVLCLQADGSALYTIQSLWTMAREQLDVTVVICANRSYKILEVELDRAAMPAGGPAKDLVDLTRPTVDFCSLAAGFGVPAVTVETSEDLVAAMADGIASAGPRLIEAVMI